MSPDTTERTGSISPAGSSSSSSSAGESREQLAGSCSPPRPALPRISVPSQPLPIDVLAVRPLASLQQPSSDVKPLLGNPFLSNSSLPFPFHTPYAVPELSQANIDSNKKYADFREKMMKNVDSIKMEEDNSSYPSPSSPSPSLNSSLPTLTSTPTHGTSTPASGKEKDAAYWERRRKNNAAAKRSRDARRAKEQEVHIRAKFLESENQELRMRLANAEALKQQAVAELLTFKAKMNYNEN